MNKKYIECCEVLTVFTSYLKNVANKSEQEKDWFTLFSISCLTLFYENNKLCVNCVKFYQLLDNKLANK